MKIWALVPQTGTVPTNTYNFFRSERTRSFFVSLQTLSLKPFDIWAPVWHQLLSFLCGAFGTIRSAVISVGSSTYERTDFFTSMLNLHICQGIIFWGFTLKSSKYIKKLFWGKCGKAKQHFASFRFWVFPLQTKFCFFHTVPLDLGYKWHVSGYNTNRSLNSPLLQFNVLC